MVKPARPWVPMPLLRYMTSHSIDIYLTTEDLQDPGNRLTVGADGRITVHWKPNNLVPHRDLVRRVVRRAGYPLIFTERMSIETNSHKCGPAVMGTDLGAASSTPVAARTTSPTCGSSAVRASRPLPPSTAPSRSPPTPCGSRR
jgi:hypothetical protein